MNNFRQMLVLAAQMDPLNLAILFLGLIGLAAMGLVWLVLRGHRQ